MNLWFCSFPVMTSPSRLSAWVGSFPLPSQPTTTSRRSLFLSWSNFGSPGMTVSNRLSVWVGSLPLLYDPPLPFHCPLFPSLFFFRFLGLLKLPSLVRMGPFEPKIGPFHILFAAHVKRCKHSIPGIVLGGLVPPSFRPTITIRPHPPATRKLFTLGIALVALPPPPPAPCTTTFR